MPYHKDHLSCLICGLSALGYPGYENYSNVCFFQNFQEEDAPTNDSFLYEPAIPPSGRFSPLVASSGLLGADILEGQGPPSSFSSPLTADAAAEVNWPLPVHRGGGGGASLVDPADFELQPAAHQAQGSASVSIPEGIYFPQGDSGRGGGGGGRPHVVLYGEGRVVIEGG